MKKEEKEAMLKIRSEMYPAPTVNFPHTDLDSGRNIGFEDGWKARSEWTPAPSEDVVAEAEKYARGETPDWDKRGNDIYNDSDIYEARRDAFISGASRNGEQPKKHIRELVNSKEDCEAVAEIIDSTGMIQFVSVEDNVFNMKFHFYHEISDNKYCLMIGENGIMWFTVNEKMAGIPHCDKIWQFILSKYSLE